jgi:hypothetical protein
MAKHDFVSDSYKNLNTWAETYSTGVGAVVTDQLADGHRHGPQGATCHHHAGQTMQAREYMAMGVIADEEVGNPSNIASAVFQG